MMEENFIFLYLPVAYFEYFGRKTPQVVCKEECPWQTIALMMGSLYLKINNINRTKHRILLIFMLETLGGIYLEYIILAWNEGEEEGFLQHIVTQEYRMELSRMLVVGWKLGMIMRECSYKLGHRYYCTQIWDLGISHNLEPIIIVTQKKLSSGIFIKI